MVRERETGERDGDRVSVCERERKREGEKGVKEEKTERARRRQALIELVIFKAISLSIVCSGAGIRKKRRSSHRFQKVSLPF